MTRRMVVFLLTAAVVALLLSTPALAATPQDIYDDYVASGTARTLTDGPYAISSLQAYLADATIHQYGDPGVVVPLDDLISKIVRYMEQGKTYEEALKLAKQGDRPLPFTGAQIALIAIAGIALVGLGIFLRRRQK